MLKNGAIYFAGRMSMALIMLVTVAIYTRLLSPAEYGVYALVLSGALMGYAVVMQWLTSSLSRFLPEYREQEDILLSHVAIGYLTVAMIIVLGALLLVPLLAPDGKWHDVLVLGVVFFLVMSFSELNLMTFQMKLEPLLYVRFALLRVVVAAAIGVALAWHGWGSVGLLLGLVVGNLCVVVPNLARIWGGVRAILLRKGLFLELAAYGFPFAMNGALAAVIIASDRYIIAHLIGTEAAGLYTAPYDLATRSLYVLMVVVAMASTPVILRVYEAEGRSAVEPLIRRQVELLLGLALPAAIALAMLSPAVTVLLGKAFQQSARELIPWIAAATVLQGVQAFYLALSFSLTKRPLRETAVLSLGALLNVVLNFALIPSLGLIGAALATVGSYALIVAGSFALGRRLLPLPFPLAGVAKILGACGVVALILWPVSDTTALPQVVVHAAAAAIAYLAIYCALDIAGTRAPALELAAGLIHAGRAGLAPDRLHRLGRLISAAFGTPASADRLSPSRGLKPR